jgi:hypothetical protein
VYIQGGSTGTLSVRNPWSGQQAEVVNGPSGAVVVAATTATATATALSVPVTVGATYLVEQPSNRTTSLSFAQVAGTQAVTDKHLGPVQIGLDPASAYSSLAASFNDVVITTDDDTAPGNFDGGYASFSEKTALTNAQAGPGAQIASHGITYTSPGTASATAVASRTLPPGSALAAGTGSGDWHPGLADGTGSLTRCG